MASALPMSTPARPHQRTQSFGQDGPASSASTSSSYTQSHPHHRRSSFPTSPNLELNEQGKTAAPCYFYLPPGLGLQLNGCGEGPSSSNSNGTSSSATFSFDGGQGVGVTTSTPSSSRKSSSSSSTTSSSSVSSATTLASSFASSLGDSSTPVYKRPSRNPVPGEDPQLAAARRALWEDIPEPGETGAPSPTNGVFEHEDLEAGTNQEAIEEDEEEEEESYCSSDDDKQARPRSLPSHTTRPPLPSCLRPPAPSRTNSQSSSSSPSPTSTTSVRISDAPPRAFTTFSPIDYERKGAAPVEKLSIREWIELQGVREAVGVWSGKIGKWEDGQEGAEAAGMSASVSSLASVEITTSATTRGEEQRCAAASRERERISCGNLAAMVGVRTVSHNNSPVEPCRSLFD